MKTESHGTSPSYYPPYQAVPPTPEEPVTYSLPGTVNSVSNNDSTIKGEMCPFEPYPGDKTRWGNFLQWFSGGSDPDDAKDAEKQTLEQVYRSGAEKMGEAEKVRYLHAQPQEPANSTASCTGNKKRLLALAALGTGIVGVGGLGSWYFSKQAASAPAAPVSAAQLDGNVLRNFATLNPGDLAQAGVREGLIALSFDVLGAGNASSYGWSTGRNNDMGNRVSGTCFTPHYPRNVTQNAAENARSLYVSGDVLEDLAQSFETLYAQTHGENAALPVEANTTTCNEQTRAQADRGRFFPKWGNTPTKNELRENSYIKDLLAKHNATIKTRDMHDLEKINPARHQRLRTTIDYLNTLLDAAVAGMQSVTNSYLPPRPKKDDHSAESPPVSRALSGEKYMGRSIENYFNDPAESLHDNLFDSVELRDDFTQMLFMLMNKARSSLQRIYPDFGNNYLNFITVDNPDTTPLFATTGNTRLMRNWFGFNQPDIILGNDFFKLSLYDAMQVILQQLSYYYTGASDLFPIGTKKYFDGQLDSEEHKTSTRDRFEQVRDKLITLHSQPETEVTGKGWTNIRKLLEREGLVNMIPGYPEQSTNADKEKLIAYAYKVMGSFRTLVDSRNAAYLSHMILAIGNEQLKIDQITHPFGKKSLGC